MAEMHNGINNRLYGKIDSDEEFTKKIHHVMKLISKGYPVSWYRNKFNQVCVHRGGKWWVIDDLCKYQEVFDWRK